MNQMQWLEQCISETEAILQEDERRLAHNPQSFGARLVRDSMAARLDNLRRELAEERSKSVLHTRGDEPVETMTRLEELIGEAEQLWESARNKAASEPDNLLAKATLASIQAQLDALRSQLRQAKGEQAPVEVCQSIPGF